MWAFIVCKIAGWEMWTPKDFRMFIRSKSCPGGWSHDHHFFVENTLLLAQRRESNSSTKEPIMLTVWRLLAREPMRVRSQHPWVFPMNWRKVPRGHTPGNPVLLQSHQGHFWPGGYGNPHSQIVFRPLSFLEHDSEPWSEEALKKTLLKAWKARFQLGYSRSFRLCFGESWYVAGLGGGSLLGSHFEGRLRSGLGGSNFDSRNGSFIERCFCFAFICGWTGPSLGLLQLARVLIRRPFGLRRCQCS